MSTACLSNYNAIIGTGRNTKHGLQAGFRSKRRLDLPCMCYLILTRRNGLFDDWKLFPMNRTFTGHGYGCAILSLDYNLKTQIATGAREQFVEQTNLVGTLHIREHQTRGWHSGFNNAKNIGERFMGTERVEMNRPGIVGDYLS